MTNVNTWYCKIEKLHGQDIAKKAYENLKKWDAGSTVGHLKDMFYSNSVLNNCLMEAFK